MSRNLLAFAKNLSNLPHETAPDSVDGPQPEAGVVPKVVEKTNRGERAYDIFSRLLKERIVMIGTPVNQKVANLIVAQLIYLSHQNDEKDIHVYINSPGGQIYSGLAIYDTMQHIEAPISTTCVGLAASLGSVLLTGGTKGKRRALPNSRMMIHQPLGGTRGQASDIEIQAEEMANIKDRLVDILAYHTDQDPATIRDDFDRDFFLDAYEAQEYGLIDEVIERHDPAVTPPSAEE